MAMTTKELVETALRVLVAWNSGDELDPREVELLKAGFPSSAHLPLDELACQVIHDFSRTVFREEESDRKPPSTSTPPSKLAG